MKYYEAKLCYAWQETEEDIFHAFEIVDAATSVDHDAMAQKLAKLLDTTPDDERFGWNFMQVRIPENVVKNIQISESAEEPQNEKANSEGCDTVLEDNIYCPWCGEEIEINEDYSLIEEGVHDRECPHCHRELTIVTEYEVKYSTSRKQQDGECAK